MSFFTPRAYAFVALCLIGLIAASSCLDIWSSVADFSGSCLIEEVQGAADGDAENSRPEFVSMNSSGSNLMMSLPRFFFTS